MQRITLLLLGLLATGCATSPQTPSAADHPVPEYRDAVAAALVFDAPIAEGVPHPELARGPRASSAFFGYQESTTEVYISATDDLQSSSWGDYYAKESVSVKSGVRYR